MRLSERVAIVTGSASRIGKAIAHRFASEGAFVIIADKNEGAIPPAVDEIEAAGGGAPPDFLSMLPIAGRSRRSLPRLSRHMAGWTSW